MSILQLCGLHTRSRDCASSLHLTSSRQSRLPGASLPPTLALVLFAATTPLSAQTSAPPAQGPSQLEPVVVSPPKPRSTAPRFGDSSKGAPKRTRQSVPTTAKPLPQSAANAGPPATPLNTNVVAGSSNLLGLTAFQTPASVQVVDQQTMRERCCRTPPAAAEGAVAGLRGIARRARSGLSRRG